MAKKNYTANLHEVIERADIILEVLDARFFEETRNKVAEQEILNLGKKIIYVLNKVDLADLKELKRKTEHLYPRVFLSCQERKGGRELRERILIILKELPYEKAFVGVIGYPNTGKSSLINLLRGRNVARASPEAGFTKGLQKIRISSKITLIDTPGVIPEEEYTSSPDEQQAVKQGKIGARMYDKVKDLAMIVDHLWKEHQTVLENYYGVSGKHFLDFLENIARKRNCVLKGGKLDLDRAARTVLQDWQRGKIAVKFFGGG